MKDIVVIGGPNGAGKTTFARELLPKQLGPLEFVNADNIVAGLSPFKPDGLAVSAGRVMLARIHQLVRPNPALRWRRPAPDVDMPVS